MSQKCISKEITLRDLYPEKPGEWCEAADEILGQYLEVVLRVYERVSGDKFPENNPEDVVPADSSLGP